MTAERAIALRGIERFSTIPVMHFRTTLVEHYERVEKILHELRPVVQHFFPEYRPRLARAIGRVHDDPELKTGDVPTNRKERMTRAEKEMLERTECEAILQLQQRYADPHERRLYGWLMMQAQSKTSLEAQIVSVADKIDGFGEAFREIFAGNPFFLEPAYEYIGRVNILPVKYPRLQPLFSHSEHPLLQPVPPIDVVALLRNKDHHRRLTGITVYDEWRRIVE